MSNITNINLIDSEYTNYKLNIKIITATVALVVIILISVYFMRTYSNKKYEVMHNMHIEANILENNFSNDINYSKYFVNSIVSQLGNNYNDLEQIQHVIQNHLHSSNFNTIFGWRKYSWFDNHFKEVITSNYGIKKIPKESAFIKKHIMESNWRNKISFYTSKTTHKNNSLKLIAAVEDSKSKEFAGAIVLSYDIATLIRRLNASKKNYYTNFVLLNDELKIVAQSKSSISNVSNKEIISKKLQQVINTNNFFQNEDKALSYLDMLSGINYYIKKVPDLPFLLIVNVDNEEIKSHIFNDVLKKLTEISFIAFVFLLMVMSIYKRESYLRSKAEQATIMANRATKTKSDFLALTAHEIRSPLSFILTGSEIMTKELFGRVPKAYRKYALGIYQNSRIILDFLTDILDENQILAGRFKIINSVTDIEEILKKAIQVNKGRFKKRKVKMILDLPPNLPQLICDQRRIFQVFSNLISNGIKYSKDHTQLKVRCYITPGQELQITVADQGEGMSKEEISSVLNLTHNSQQPKKHKFIDSYGLGLPIVKMLLDAHDADLMITSELGVGTTIKITFPKYKLLYNKA